MRPLYVIGQAQTPARAQTTIMFPAKKTDQIRDTRVSEIREGVFSSLLKELSLSYTTTKKCPLLAKSVERDHIGESVLLVTRLRQDY